MMKKKMEVIVKGVGDDAKERVKNDMNSLIERHARPTNTLVGISINTSSHSSTGAVISKKACLQNISFIVCIIVRINVGSKIK